MTSPCMRCFCHAKGMSQTIYNKAILQQTLHYRRVFKNSTRATASTQILEYPAGSSKDKKQKEARRTVWELHSSDSSPRWHQQKKQRNGNHRKAYCTQSNLTSIKAALFQSSPAILTSTITTFLFPAAYPSSVAPGYAAFAVYSGIASIAGSAAMLISTQALFVAIGVHPAGLAAAATHWIWKDGVGQAMGAIMLVAQSTSTSSFDASPKSWRMCAAIALDIAALLEVTAAGIVAVSEHSEQHMLVLALACTAGLLKNVGFLTASASRAALHQALARSHNLGDITAKSGSQSMIAGLIGTAIGLGVLAPLCQEGGVVVLGSVYATLVGIHQLGNYFAVRAVALTHLNPVRLEIVLRRFLETGMVLTPEDVALLEPVLVSPTAVPCGVFIGKGMAIHQHNQQTDCMLRQNNFVVTVYRDDVYLTFGHTATPQTQIAGFLFAMRTTIQSNKEQGSCGTIGAPFEDKGDREVSKRLLALLVTAGWKLSETNLEFGSAARLQVLEGANN